MVPTRSGPRTSVLPKLLLGVTVALLVLGGTELLLRLFLGPPPPPVRVFGGLDQVDQLIDIEGGQVIPVFQERALGGLGDRPDPGAGNQAVPLPFPLETDQTRVVVIGGSSVHGGNGSLRLEQEFPQLLDALPGLEVRNLGAPAMDSFELVRLTQQLQAVPHDLLVVYTGHNDYANTWFQGRFGDLGGGLSARAGALLGHLQIYTRLHRLIRPPTGSPVPLGPSQRPKLQADQLAHTADNLARNLRRITWTSQHRGVPVVLLTPVSDLLHRPLADRCVDLDGQQDCALARWRAGMATSDPQIAAAELARARDLDGVPLRAHTPAAAAVRRVAEETGATLVDTELLLPRAPHADVPAAELFTDPVHLSAQGHAAVAALLRPIVQQIH